MCTPFLSDINKAGAPFTDLQCFFGSDHMPAAVPLPYTSQTGASQSRCSQLTDLQCTFVQGLLLLLPRSWGRASEPLKCGCAGQAHVLGCSGLHVGGAFK